MDKSINLAERLNPCSLKVDKAPGLFVKIGRDNRHNLPRTVLSVSPACPASYLRGLFRQVLESFLHRTPVALNGTPALRRQAQARARFLAGVALFDLDVPCGF